MFSGLGLAERWRDGWMGYGWIDVDALMGVWALLKLVLVSSTWMRERQLDPCEMQLLYM
jgi:hypothetical protein